MAYFLFFQAIFTAIVLWDWKNGDLFSAVAIFIFLDLILVTAMVCLSSSELAKAYTKANGDLFVGEHSVSFDDGGITHSEIYGEGRRNWSGIGQIERLGNFIHIKFKSHTLFFIPTSAFSSPEEANRFYESVKEYSSRSPTDKIERRQIQEENTT